MRKPRLSTLRWSEPLARAAATLHAHQLASHERETSARENRTALRENRTARERTLQEETALLTEAIKSMPYDAKKVVRYSIATLQPNGWYVAERARVPSRAAETALALSKRFTTRVYVQLGVGKNRMFMPVESDNFVEIDAPITA